MQSNGNPPPKCLKKEKKKKSPQNAPPTLSLDLRADKPFAFSTLLVLRLSSKALR